MSVKTFIEGLQASDSRRKLRWLVGLSMLTMIVVVGIWAMTIPDPGGGNGLVRKEDQPGLLDRVSMGTSSVVATLRLKTANTINFFKSKLSKTNTIEVEATQSE